MNDLEISDIQIPPTKCSICNRIARDNRFAYDEDDTIWCEQCMDKWSFKNMQYWENGKKIFLKPCPFCYSQPTIRQYLGLPNLYEYGIACDSCNFQLPLGSLYDIVDKWNKRA